MDIDVEHDGQRTKVTPPSQSGGEEGNVEMDGVEGVEGGASEGSKVSLCDVFQLQETISLKSVWFKDQ